MDEVGILLCCYCKGKSHDEAIHSDDPTTYVYYYKGEIIRYTGKGGSHVKNHLIEFPPLGEVVCDYIRLMKLKMFIDSMIIKYVMRHNQHDINVPDDSGIVSYNHSYHKFFDKALVVVERDYKITKILE